MLNIKELRERYGLSQQGFADFAGVSRQMVTRIEKEQAGECPDMGFVHYRHAAAIVDALFALIQAERSGGEPQILSMPRVSCTSWGRNIYSFYCLEDCTESWLAFWLGGLR